MSIIESISKYYECDRNVAIATKYNNQMRFANAVKELQGIAYVVIFDDQLSNSEIKIIAQWLIKNNEFIKNWPISIVNEQFLIPVRCKKISDEWKTETLEVLKNFSLEQKIISDIFDEFSEDFLYDGKVMVTGNFVSGHKRSEVFKLLEEIGAIPNKDKKIYSTTGLLIVGEKGSPAYRFGSFGSKIKQAVDLREKNGKPHIIKEVDFINYCRDKSIL